jgi:hypothetical protein
MNFLSEKLIYQRLFLLVSLFFRRNYFDLGFSICEVYKLWNPPRCETSRKDMWAVLMLTEIIQKMNLQFQNFKNEKKEQRKMRKKKRGNELTQRSQIIYWNFTSSNIRNGFGISKHIWRCNQISLMLSYLNTNLLKSNIYIPYSVHNFFKLHVFWVKICSKTCQGYS